MDEYKVKQLRQMLAHETDSGEHFGAWLSHWYGDTRTLTIDVGGLKALTAVSTPDELIICIEIDGKITKSYERRRISDDEVEVIQHRNRDRLGNYYTTRHIYRISEGAVVNSDFAQGSCGKDLFPAAREETQP